ncbi:hypothetical protein VTJ04DRAFT_1716 [Mycothermus thermophilus]|uniref:uncharacterized protein n=1 Tax=Humicola insolens TaxID=85995 RepID=UPI003743E1ED
MAVLVVVLSQTPPGMVGPGPCCWSQCTAPQTRIAGRQDRHLKRSLLRLSLVVRLLPSRRAVGMCVEGGEARLRFAGVALLVVSCEFRVVRGVGDNPIESSASASLSKCRMRVCLRRPPGAKYAIPPKVAFSCRSRCSVSEWRQQAGIRSVFDDPVSP